MPKWYDKLITSRQQTKGLSWLREVISGSVYSVADMKHDSSLADIKTQIDTMRALARDSQISTALSYYATDATTANSSGDIIWATPESADYKEAADIINALFKRWKVNSYARDHILELATIGNLYLPTTDTFKEPDGRNSAKRIALGNNTIVDEDYNIVPAYNIPPENVLHIWSKGEPKGYIVNPDDSSNVVTIYPESSIIHFSLGGLLGKYTVDAVDSNRNEVSYDIQFAQPLMEKAVQPTQTLSLLEDAMVLSSLTRIVKFVNVECGNAEETEIQNTLLQLKQTIEQQLSLNTNSGDVQSFVNPSAPTNLIYLPRVNGQDAISITDLNMAEATETDSKLLQYYQDKKLSVLGVPKEAMNFSSAEGLGNAGSVMSQRSALYANSLQRLENAYIEGWKDAMNKYFQAHGLSGFVDHFSLHMTPIVTELSSINFEKRDAAITQAQTIVDLFKALQVTDTKDVKVALTEILSEVLPKTGAAVNGWNVDVQASESAEGGEF